MADPIDLANDITQRILESQISNALVHSNLESATHCEECDNPIPEGRRLAAKGTQHCIDCAEHFERKRV
ncbi:TraR/DksA family transcriptional regulator [Acinetobacter proteolyticus]|uniref:Conjugal transfer protein TraR n=1 Tax=Acinetobacter proteolyticus TaxID=1776741 RepID=A0A2N0WI86_9GAMM|nr:TraR/DksA family transcriptional regulator [Acinetobacter proteolyticus]PKF35525.1 conjugal transfer protein TraR [Acinetobacter proteolyticus]